MNRRWIACVAAVAVGSGLHLARALNRPNVAPKLDWPPAATQSSATQPVDVPEAKMHAPAETIAMTRVPPGYHLELVAAEPDVVAPVCLAWDGDGRMYVAEMRSYMLDLDASREKEPVSRVSRFEDTTGRGVYDKHTIFADGLMLPRMILPLDDRILIRMTDTKDVMAFRDTTGSGRADEQVKVYAGGPANGNLEHQASGLIWDLDNWIYLTHDGVRLRYKDALLESDKNTHTTGQWGIAMDDAGRLTFSTAGNEQPAHDFQTMPQYGRFALKGELTPGFTEVFSILPTTDFQGGPKRVKDGGGLTNFTGCGGPSVYRGDALPADLYGDLILPEPVGRLIRRAKVKNVDGKTVLSNAYEGEEFIASRDANFRPVWTATGPDGCIYICDMYHGIIQEHEWTKQGTYLRPQIQKYGLEKNVGGGRIYRLVFDGMRRREKPHMLEETSAQLAAHLADPNGWWRDTAQKLLVVRGDKSVVPALEAMARAHANPIARLHALWTLDGLDAASNELVIEKFKDADDRLRCAAIRIAEPRIAKNDPKIMAAVVALGTDADPNVATQYCLSLIYSKNLLADSLVKSALAARTEAKLSNETPKMVVEMKYQAIAKAVADAAKQKVLANADPKLAALVAEGKANFAQTCIACHGLDGKGQAAPDNHGLLAPPLAGSKRLTADKEIVARIVLRGLTGPHDGGRTYPNEMAGFAFLDDRWVASILTYARQSFGNHAGPIWPEDLAKIRRATETRDKPFTLPEIDAVKATTPP